MEIQKVSQNEYKFIFTDATITTGNLLQKELLTDKNVKYAGCICPHPLETKMIVTIITYGKNPKEIFVTAFNNVIAKLENLEKKIILCQ